ncbi:FtsX-like permease family protein [Pontiellaceae bacterium B1224]|nr:FtsX-like permease family protein [Pontiellaceae bacterium B1224]
MVNKQNYFNLLLVHLQRFSWRHVRRAPWTSGSLLAIVALGVAVFFSVRLSNLAAVAGFQLFTQSISGGSDFVVTGAAGTLPVEQLPDLREQLNPLPVLLLPIVEGTASLPGTGNDADDFDAAQVPIIGMDLLAARNLAYARKNIGYRPFEEREENGFVLGRPDMVFATDALAQRMDLKSGAQLIAIIGDRPHSMRLEAIMVPDAFQAGKAEELLIMDLPALQSLLGQPDQVDRVEIVVPEGNSAAAIRKKTAERLKQLPPEIWSWSTTQASQNSAQTMTAAFRLNLTILSALSLLVGVYLIMQAMEAAVVRRRTEIGILLSMGCEPRWIRRAWLAESLILGVIGSALGLAFGWILAQASVRAVAQTVNALYVSTTADAAAWNTGEAAVAFGLGVLATVLAGSLPARDAAATLPVQVMRRESRSDGIRLLDAPWIGIILLVAGGLASLVGPLNLGPGNHFPLGGYLAATCWLLGAAILSGNLIQIIPGLAQPLAEKSPIWRMAASQFRRPSGRQKLTIAGLVVAVGMASGMEILTHSFERTVSVWINRSLKADLFVAVKGIENASNRNKISETVWQALMNDPVVKKVDVGHFFQIMFRDAPTMLMGIRSNQPWSDEHLIWAEKPREPVRLDAPPARPDQRKFLYPI